MRPVCPARPDLRQPVTRWRRVPTGHTKGQPPMTNTPGWASPGSSDSPEPDGGDSPEDTPSAARGENDSAQEAPAAPAAPPVSGVWSQQQPPPGRWHTPSGADPYTAAPAAPRP